MRLVGALGERALSLRGNGDAVLELTRGTRPPWGPRASWVELRQTSYDVAEALAVGPRLGDPAAEVIANLLTSPPGPAQIIEEAEGLVFSD